MQFPKQIAARVFSDLIGYILILNLFKFGMTNAMLPVSHSIFRSSHLSLLKQDKSMQMLQEAVSPEEFISRRIADSIRKLGYPKMRTLDCKSIGSTLILSGELTSFYQAQLVLKVAAREPGIENIESQIQIVSQDSMLPET